jgi:hypothetical protein
MYEPFGLTDSVHRSKSLAIPLRSGSMYSLEDKLRKKYGNGFSVFPLDFLDRIRGLDEIRRSFRPIEPYSRPSGKSGTQKGLSRVYYLFDASALHHVYVPDEKLIARLDHFIEQRGLGRAFLFVPNFCVAEVFNSLARKHYRQHELTPDQYRLCKDEFRRDIHNGLLFYHYELNRYHVLNTDYIVPLEHLFETQRPKGTKKGEEWRLSTLDLLIIGMGIEQRRTRVAPRGRASGRVTLMVYPTRVLARRVSRARGSARVR